MNNNSTMSFGKYKGKQIINLPSDYLLWLAENVEDGDICYTADKEYQMREKYNKHFYSEKENKYPTLFPMASFVYKYPSGKIMEYSCSNPFCNSKCKNPKQYDSIKDVTLDGWKVKGNILCPDCNFGKE